ncbi:MAG: hypothetical protein GWN79_10685, partial [Actinobacteria bacterium]|nr:hypothetical protein [Actinomycetota bacterium]NIU19519.1 hypothetical protein [Actinomycetota bacterium]NIU64970.1 hypothetical protein [Actinomycetota bacterium]NIW26776.1 hypothetical protein [Actinomycetota bacterium]
MAFLITGSGERTAATGGGLGDRSPVLEIEFMPVPNAAPVVTITAPEDAST